MGVPFNKLICASNENKVLYDFFRTGTYDKNRKFILTSSPSMDILVSSNLERLIYLIAGEDSQKTKELMDALSSDGTYTITEEMKKKLTDFDAGFADEKETSETIRKVYERTGYVMDTHTAVAAEVCREYQERTGDQKKCIVASTASPYKFVKSVLTAIDPAYGQKEELDLMQDLSKLSNREIPKAVLDILDARILHTTECDAEKMKETVKAILKV